MSAFRLEDIPDGDLKEIADKCGLDSALLVWQHFPGSQLYIPKADDVRRTKHVLDHYNGHNVRDLARTLHISERAVYQILQSKKQASETQLNLIP